MPNKCLIFRKEEGVATIILNRPEKLNAINDEIRLGLQECVAEVRQNDELKVLIITGAGRGFCSGGDVKGLANRLPGETVKKTRQEILRTIGTYLLPLAKLEKPTIAAVNGIAAGGGFSLCLMCDIRIASEQAEFRAVWVSRGFIPDDGATFYLPKLIGLSRALTLMYTGNPVSAREAEKIGLVNEVVPHDELLMRATELARIIARGPSVAIELMKRTVYSGIVDELESRLVLETYAQNICRQTEDHKEAIKAFLEKRKPVFRGL